MNFFRKDPQQDKYFVEIRNSLELAYWVASDSDNFIEFFPELLDRNNLSIIIDNSEQLKKLLNVSKDRIRLQLTGDHKECALLLEDYIQSMIKELDIKQSNQRKNESEDIKYTRILDIDSNFRKNYFKYMLRDVEYYRLESYSKLSSALKEILAYGSCLDDDLESDFADKKRNKILKYLSEAERLILRSNRQLNINRRTKSIAKISQAGEYVVKDLNHTHKWKSSRAGDPTIAFGSGYFSEEYHRLQTEYNLIWQGVIQVQKETFTQINDLDIDELNFLDFQGKQYYSKLNEVGFKINEFILNGMNAYLPKFELLSSKTIKNHLQFLNV